jgi:inositol-phosphate transport system substrate-binding protein
VRVLAAILAAAAAALTGCGAEGERRAGDAGGRTRLVAWTIGPEPTSFTRKTNLIEAARRITADRPASPVAIDVDYATVASDAYQKKLVFAFASGRSPDIVCGGHELIGQLAPAGYIVPLDDMLTAHAAFRADVFPVLWQAMQWDGRTFGVPQDNEVRLVYLRADVLRKAGWSEERVAGLPGRVERGEVSLDDYAAIAEEVVASGAIPPGNAIWHRTRTGFDWMQFVLAFGGRLSDPATGKLVVSRRAALATMRFFDRLTGPGAATPPGMMSFPERTIMAGFTGGPVLSYLTGGSWLKLEWTEGFDIAPERWERDFINFPIPGGRLPGAEGPVRPVSVSHPFACAVSARSANPELALEVIVRSLDTDLDVAHALGSSHLVVRKESSTSAPYRRDPFLQRMISLLRFTTFAPNHPKLTRLQRIIYDAIRGVEVGALTPEEAAEFFEDVARARLGDTVVVED